MADMSFEKVLVKETASEQVISQWVKPELKKKGFNLSVVCLNCHPFGLTLNLMIGDLKEFKDCLDKVFNTKIDKEGNAMYVGLDHEGKRWHFMSLPQGSWRASDYGLIAHELHHFVHEGLEEKGVSYGRGGEEVFAYVQGYFMELIIRAIVTLDRKEGRLPKKSRGKKK